MADDATKGYGQQDPSDSVGPFNPHAFAIAQQLARVSTNKIVKVMAVDTSKKTVDVQIAVNQLDGQNNATPHGTISGIPYVFAMGGTNAFMTDPAVGDLGIMCVSDRDISSVKSTKAIANPGSLRKFSPSDGIYLFSVPGLNGAAPAQWIKWTTDGINITANHGNGLVSNANGWFFTGPVTMNGALQLGGALTAAGGGELAIDIKTTGDVVASTISLKTHRTTGVTTGGGISGVPTP
jgi:hypothetical protein